MKMSMYKELPPVMKGYFGSLIVEKKFIENGFQVFKPTTENGKVDMIIEKFGVYLKLQIKTISITKEGNKLLPVRKISHNMGEYKISRYSENDIDYFIGVDIETEDLYIAPIEFTSTYSSSIAISKMQEYKNNFELVEILQEEDLN